MIAGPALTSLGIRGNMQLNVRTCLIGALAGVAVAYWYELPTGRYSHRVLHADASLPRDGQTFPVGPSRPDAQNGRGSAIR